MTECPDFKPLTARERKLRRKIDEGMELERMSIQKQVDEGLLPDGIRLVVGRAGLMLKTPHGLYKMDRDIVEQLKQDCETALCSEELLPVIEKGEEAME